MRPDLIPAAPLAYLPPACLSLALAAGIAAPSSAVATAATAATAGVQCQRTTFSAREIRGQSTLPLAPYYQASQGGHWKPIIRMGPPEEPHAEFAFVPTGRASDSHRARIQLNYYQLPERTDLLELEFSFSLTRLMDPAMNSDVSFDWLTVFELWNEPDWIGSDYPFRVSLNLTKRPDEPYLQPRLYGQTKDREDGKWHSQWATRLDFRIKPGVRTRFRFSADLGQPGGMVVELESEDQYLSFIAPRRFLVHPERPDDRSLWGFNPVKLYTSNAVLDRLDANGGRLAITYFPATVCTGVATADQSSGDRGETRGSPAPGEGEDKGAGAGGDKSEGADAGGNGGASVQ